MATYENGMKPSLSQVKPLSTSETVEHDPAVEHDLNIQHKLVLRPWRVRYNRSAVYSFFNPSTPPQHSTFPL